MVLIRLPWADFLHGSGLPSTGADGVPFFELAVCFDADSLSLSNVKHYQSHEVRRITGFKRPHHPRLFRGEAPVLSEELPKNCCDSVVS